jgi:hypothetical protein
MRSERNDWSVGSGFTVQVDGKTYTYKPEIQEETPDDPGGRGMQKIFHHVYDPEGNRYDLDWSPYGYPTREEVATWISLGMPGRSGRGPIDSKELAQMASGDLTESEINYMKSIAGLFE